jgi:hypothetical protein
MKIGFSAKLYSTLAVVLSLFFGSIGAEVAVSREGVTGYTAAQNIDPPRNTPRWTTNGRISQWFKMIRVLHVLTIDRDHGHLPKFTDENIVYFVDYASDRDYDRFWTALENGNVLRPRTIFRYFIDTWG